jgi:hypothetical protein
MLCQQPPLITLSATRPLYHLIVVCWHHAVSHVPPLSLASSKLLLQLLIPFPSLFDVKRRNEDIVGCHAVPLTPPSLALLYVQFKFNGDSKGIAVKEEFLDRVMLFAVFHAPAVPPHVPPH